MNREQAKAIAPYIKAFGDGEDVQFHDGVDWSDIGEEGIDAEAFENGRIEWRIKPKPREWWLDPTDGEILQQDTPPNSDFIKVREVLS